MRAGSTRILISRSRPPTSVDGADAGDLLDALLDLVVGDLGELADRQVAGEGDREHGGGAGVELLDDGGSMPLGSSRSIAETLSRTSCKAWLPSTSSSTRGRPG
jgi:hypothetical protein